jgi:membrane protease YdiL (CAAX protease family)
MNISIVQFPLCIVEFLLIKYNIVQFLLTIVEFLPMNFEIVTFPLMSFFTLFKMFGIWPKKFFEFEKNEIETAVIPTHLHRMRNTEKRNT